MTTATCPNAQQLAAFQAGRLQHNELSMIAEHLESCALCQTALETGSTGDDALIQEVKLARNDDPFATESGCRLAIARIEALANTDATHTRDDTADHVPPTATPLMTLGKYCLMEAIGHGGMGEVFKATHTVLKKTVAVKLLPADRLNNPDAVARFRREIEAAGRLDHAHIVRASDADCADGRHFLVMEWLDGQDLAHLVHDKGPLPVQQACDFIRQAALGLGYAHEHGMVHRDVKPSNLMLTTVDGQPMVKVLDLGLALLHDNNVTPETELTSAGQVMGTYDFISPEQAMESHTVDARADMYSLGCTFYFLLTGHTPFQGKTATKKLLAHQLEKPTPLSHYRNDLPDGVTAVVVKMMEKDPARRYASMRELGQALTKAADTQIVAPQECPSTITQVRASTAKPRRGSPRAAVALVLGVLVVVTAIVLGVIRISTPEGDYTIETNDPDFLFSVSKGTVLLEDKKTKRKYQLKAVEHKKGEFELELTDVEAEFLFQTKSFTIKRGETVALRAWFERKPTDVKKDLPVDNPQKNKSSEPLAPDKATPFLLIGVDGKTQQPFKHFDEAIKALHDGDTIEVHGNGPFRIGPVRLKGIGLRLKAAPGYRPRFEPNELPGLAGTWFNVEKSALLVEGCDFRLGAYRVMMFYGDGPSWAFTNCKLLRSWGPAPVFSSENYLVAFTGEHLTVEDCLIVDTTPSGTMFNVHGKTATKIHLSNNVLLNRFGSIIGAIPKGQRITLRDNTIGSGVGNLIAFRPPGKNDLSDPSMTIDATNNVIAPTTGFGNWRKELEGKIRWSGKRNFFGPTSARLGEGEIDKDHGLKKWAKVLGSEEKSLEAQPDFRWNYVASNSLSDGVKHIKVLLSNGQAKQPMASTAGPDWDLIGPGQGYLNALAAAGKPVPSKMFKETASVGPFSIIRKGKWIGTHPSITKAIAATEDDDVIEISGSGKYGSISYFGSKTGRRLTLRSAPGYRPVLGLVMLNEGDAISLEGIHFESSVGGNKIGSIVRIANCSFEAGFGLYSISLGTKNQTTEIISCWIPTGFNQVNLPAGSRAVFRNTLIGQPRFTLNGAASVDFQRCVIWSPGFRSEGDSGISWAGGKLNVAMADTIWESRTMSDIGSLSQWQGARNVFRFPCSPWLEMLVQEGNKEEGSIHIDPLIYDPQQWRLLPSSPGYRAGIDGKDIGADVDRVAVTQPLKSKNSETKVVPPVIEIAPLNLQVPISSVGFVDDDTVIAGCGKQIHFWNWRTGKRSEIEDPNCRGSFVLSPDRSKAVFGFDSSALILLDCKNQKKLYFKGVDGPIADAVFSPDGKKVVGVGNNSISNFDVAEGIRTELVPTKWENLNKLAMSPVDGKLLILSSKPQEFRHFLWNPEKREGTVVRFAGGSYVGDFTHYCTFSKDGKKLLGCAAGSIAFSLRDMLTLKETQFQGHTGNMLAVAFSPDEKLILSGSSDRTVRLWSVDTREELRCFKGHTKDVTAVAFSPNGQYAVSGSKEGAVRVWRLLE